MAASAASRSSPCGSSPPATAASSRLLDCEDELLAVAGAVDIAYFLEATRAEVDGPYDLSLVEGSITTAHDAERIREVRRQSRRWSPSAPAPPPAASRRCATSPMSASSCRSSMRGRTTSDARHLDADRGARAGRLRAARLPDQQAPAARGDQRLPGPAASRRCRRTASASSASSRAMSASWSPTARRASGRSPMPAAARSARATIAAATAAYGPMETPNTALARR